MFTSCAVMSTFDASSAPDCTRPKPELPAWPRSAWPERERSRAQCRVAELLQALRIREVRHRDLAERLRAAVGEARLHDAGLVDVDADQAAGGVSRPG